MVRRNIQVLSGFWWAGSGRWTGWTAWTEWTVNGVNNEADFLGPHEMGRIAGGD
jgi:hypothetical protein